MQFKTLLTTLLSLWLVYQDGGKATALLCKARKTVPITKEQLSEMPRYLVAHVDSRPDNRNERCVKSIYTYDPKNDKLNNTRTSIRDSDNTLLTRVSDIYASTSGVYDMIPRNEGGAIIISSYLEYTSGESVVSAHCEMHDGEPYTDRITAAFANRNVDPEKIRQKLQSVGVKDFSNMWIIPQTNCED